MASFPNGPEHAPPALHHDQNGRSSSKVEAVVHLLAEADLGARTVEDEDAAHEAALHIFAAHPSKLARIRDLGRVFKRMVRWISFRTRAAAARRREVEVPDTLIDSRVGTDPAVECAHREIARTTASRIGDLSQFDRELFLRRCLRRDAASFRAILGQGARARSVRTARDSYHAAMARGLVALRELSPQARAAVLRRVIAHFEPLVADSEGSGDGVERP